MTNDSPRLLHIITSLGVGGAENHLLDLVCGLADDGYDVTVMYLTDKDPYADEDVTSEMVEAGVSVEQIGIRNNIDPIGFGRVLLHILQNGYDIVHTHQIHGDIYGSVAATLGGVQRIVSTKHNDPPFLTEQPYKTLHNMTVRLTDRIVTISENVREFTLEHTTASPDKVRTVHYGLDPQPFDQVSEEEVNSVRSDLADAEEPLVGTVARLVEQKDLGTLLRAIDKVSETHPNVRLAIVGEGPKREELESLASDLGIDDRVTFTGYRSDIPALMQAFDVFALPSRWEGFGLVFLEAMAAGTPVVASEVSAVPEIVVDAETGYLVPPGESDEFAEYIDHLLEEPSLAERMGQSGRARLEAHFTVEQMVSETEAVYDELF